MPEKQTLTINQQNITFVTVERLTDDELAFYEKLLKSGRAVPVEALLPPQDTPK